MSTKGRPPTAEMQENRIIKKIALFLQNAKVCPNGRAVYQRLNHKNPYNFGLFPPFPPNTGFLARLHYFCSHFVSTLFTPKKL
jgi:hypothetical protein